MKPFRESSVSSHNMKKTSEIFISPEISHNESEGALRESLSGDRPTYNFKIVEKDMKDKYSRFYKISGKIIEAKSLNNTNMKPGNCPENEIPDVIIIDDYIIFCTFTVNNDDTIEKDSMAVPITDSPFWAEDFQFVTHEGFNDIQFVVKIGAGITANSSPVGKVTIPRRMIKKSAPDDKNYLVFQAENDVHCGKVKLEIIYHPPNSSRNTHCISVNVVGAKGLNLINGGQVNPFVVLHLLPDMEALTTQHTHVQMNTLYPVFGEMFFFRCPNDVSPYRAELHCAVWHKDASKEKKFLLGNVTIPLGPLIYKGGACKWYTLAPSHIVPEKNEKSDKKKENPHDKARDLVKSFNNGESRDGLIDSPHLWEDKTYALGTCSQCNSHMMGQHIYCMECNISVHQKCQEAVPATCGSLGTLRIRVAYERYIAFEPIVYKDFIQILVNDNFAALQVLEKVGNNREEIARCLIRVLGDDFLPFLLFVLENEIKKAPDSQTLFRANSLASKTLDVFMKYVGLEYLDSTLKDVLKLFVLSKKPFELDPSRLDKKKDVLEANILNFTELNEIILHEILQSGKEMPPVLRIIFKHIRDNVVERFPDDEMVQYTSISGFLFLRFFAAAILGPHLFGLNVGVQDALTTRKFTLIAKTVQNISNFVEFGQKELFMEGMNGFIKTMMPTMKNFIREVSDYVPSYKYVKKEFTPQELAQDSAELVNLISQSISNLSATDIESEPITKLSSAISIIEQKIALIKSYEYPFDFADDIGSTIESHNLSPVDKTILKKCIDTTNGAAPGVYRDASDVIRSIEKGVMYTVPDNSIKIQNTISTPPLATNDDALPTIEVTILNPIHRTITPDNFTIVEKKGHLDSVIDQEGGIKHEKSNSRHRSGSSTVGRASTVLAGFSSIFTNSSGLNAEEQNDDADSPPSVSSRRRSNIWLRDLKELMVAEVSEEKLFKGDIKEKIAAESSELKGRKEKSFSEAAGSIPPIINPEKSVSSFWRPLTVRKGNEGDDGTPKGRTRGKKEKKDLSGLSNTCRTCKEDLKEDAIIGKLKFHNSCLKCFTCQCDLMSQKGYLFKNDLFCKSHYYIESEFICHECRTEITEECIKVNGSIMYHPNCKRCGHCNDLISAKPFSVVDDIVICSQHVDAFPSCLSCLKKIDGPLVQSGNHFFHIPHLMCYMCSKDLNGCVTYHSDDNKHILCQTCFSNCEFKQEQPPDNKD